MPRYHEFTATWVLSDYHKRVVQIDDDLLRSLTEPDEDDLVRTRVTLDLDSVVAYFENKHQWLDDVDTTEVSIDGSTYVLDIHYDEFDKLVRGI